MSPARRLALSISRNGFRLLLVIAVTLGAIYLSFGTADQIKLAFREAKAYDRFVTSVIDSNVRADKSSIFADKQVAEIAKNAFSPALLKVTTESFVDDWYAWLRGDTVKPTFVYNFSAQRHQLAEQLSIYAMDRLAALPQCTAFEAEITLDPFKAACQPAGINFRDEQLNLQAQLLESKDFFPDVVFTDADLPKSQSGKTIAESFWFAPYIYQFAPSILVVVLAIMLLLAITSIGLRPVKRNAWHELGMTLFSSGIFLAISGVIFGLFVPQITRSYQNQFIGNGTDRLFSDVVRNISVGFESVFISISLQITVVGAVILLGLRMVKPASRYKGLERVTGLVNGMRPTIDTLTAKRAIGAPVVSSERQRKPHRRAKAKRGKKSRAAKEVA